LLDRVSIPPLQVHRMAGEDDPVAAATAYEQMLRALFGSDPDPPRRSFDLALLGMGEDGHTASLFPGTPPVTEARRWVLPNRGPHATWRITLTPIVLNAAAAVVFVVAGASKAERLAQALQAPARAPLLPIQHIHPGDGALTWMVDAAAGARVNSAVTSSARASANTNTGERA
jgi:6-phosphogluconolactonase